MKLKLLHLFVATALAAIWLAILTQAPLPLLLLAPFPVSVFAASWNTTKPFLLRSLLGGVITVLFQWLTCAAMVAMDHFDGFGKSAFPPNVTSIGDFVGLCILCGIWSAMVSLVIYTLWDIVRFFVCPDE